MLDLTLFRKPAFDGASIAAFALSASMFSMFLYLTLYIQNILDYTPLESGLRFLPVTLLSFIVAPISGKFAERVGIRWFMGGGLACVGDRAAADARAPAGRRLDRAAGRLPDRRRRHRARQPGARDGGGRRGRAAARGHGVRHQLDVPAGRHRHRHRRARRDLPARRGAEPDRRRARAAAARRQRQRRRRLRQLRRLPPAPQRGAHPRSPSSRSSTGSTTSCSSPRSSPSWARSSPRCSRARAISSSTAPEPACSRCSSTAWSSRGSTRDPAHPHRARRGGRQPLRRHARRRPRRPAPDALDGDRRGPAAHRPPLPPARGHARSAASRCCSCRRSPRPRSASTCGAAARWPSTCCRAATRPTSSTTARSSTPTAGSGSSTGSRRSCRRRSAPRARTPAAARSSSSAGAWAASSRCSRSPPTRMLPVSRAALVASPFDFSKVPLVAPLRPIAAITQGWGISQLYRLLGGAPAPLVKRGYQLGRHRQVPDEAVDRALQPARPRAAGPDRGGRRVHGPHARLPRAHVRPAVPPLLPHQRPRRRPARARGPHARPRGREAAGAGGRGPRRRDRAGPGLPSRRGAAPARQGRARHRAGRPPRRADRPRRRGDDLEAARRLPRQALQRAVQSARSRGRARPERLPSAAHGPSHRPHRAPPPRPRRTRRRPGAADRGRHQGRPPRRRRPHRQRGDREAAAELQRVARPAALGPRRRATATASR